LPRIWKVAPNESKTTKDTKSTKPASALLFHFSFRVVRDLAGPAVASHPLRRGFTQPLIYNPMTALKDPHMKTYLFEINYGRFRATAG